MLVSRPASCMAFERFATSRPAGVSVNSREARSTVKDPSVTEVPSIVREPSTSEVRPTAVWSARPLRNDSLMRIPAWVGSSLRTVQVPSIDAGVPCAVAGGGRGRAGALGEAELGRGVVLEEDLVGDQAADGQHDHDGHGDQDGLLHATSALSVSSVSSVRRGPGGGSAPRPDHGEGHRGQSHHRANYDEDRRRGLPGAPPARCTGARWPARGRRDRA